MSSAAFSFPSPFSPIPWLISLLCFFCNNDGFHFHQKLSNNNSANRPLKTEASRTQRKVNFDRHTERPHDVLLIFLFLIQYDQIALPSPWRRLISDEGRQELICICVPALSLQVESDMCLS